MAEAGEVCERCKPLAISGEIRLEAVGMMRGAALDALARDGSGPCCQDCAAADAVAYQSGSDFVSARKAVAVTRLESRRHPGVPFGLIGQRLMHGSPPGEQAAVEEFLERELPDLWADHKRRGRGPEFEREGPAREQIQGRPEAKP